MELREQKKKIKVYFMLSFQYSLCFKYVIQLHEKSELLEKKLNVVPMSA